MNSPTLDELLISISDGDCNAVGLLTEKYNINSIGTNRMTSIMCAAFGGHCNVIRTLISCGAIIDQRNSDGQNALHFAAQEGRCESIKTLVSFGADIETATSDGCTPLIISAAMGQLAAVKLLSSMGADLYHREVRGMTAWMVAVEKGEEEIAQFLGKDERKGGETGVV